MTVSLTISLVLGVTTCLAMGQETNSHEGDAYITPQIVEHLPAHQACIDDDARATELAAILGRAEIGNCADAVATLEFNGYACGTDVISLGAEYSQLVSDICCRTCSSESTRARQESIVLDGHDHFEDLFKPAAASIGRDPFQKDADPYDELQRDLHRMITHKSLGHMSVGMLPQLREKMMDRLQLFGSPSGHTGNGGGWTMYRDGPKGMVIMGVVPQITGDLQVHMMAGGKFGPPMLVVSGTTSSAEDSDFQRAFKLPRSVQAHSVGVEFSKSTGVLRIKTPGYFARADAMTSEEIECICRLMHALRNIFNTQHRQHGAHSVGSKMGKGFRGAVHSVGMQPKSEAEERVAGMMPKIMDSVRKFGAGHLGKANAAYWRLTSHGHSNDETVQSAEPAAELKPQLEVVVKAAGTEGITPKITKSKRGKDVVVVTDNSNNQQIARVSLPLPVKGNVKLVKDRKTKGRFIVRYDIAEDAVPTVERLPVVLRDEL